VCLSIIETVELPYKFNCPFHSKSKVVLQDNYRGVIQAINDCDCMTTARLDTTGHYAVMFIRKDKKTCEV
jgi:hypothetical protein